MRETVLPAECNFRWNAKLATIELKPQKERKKKKILKNNMLIVYEQYM